MKASFASANSKAEGKYKHWFLTKCNTFVRSKRLNQFIQNDIFSEFPNFHYIHRIWNEHECLWRLLNLVLYHNPFENERKKMENLHWKMDFLCSIDQVLSLTNAILFNQFQMEIKNLFGWLFIRIPSNIIGVSSWILTVAVKRRWYIICSL